MLINVLRDETPTHVAVAFDRGEPTFRHEQWVEYKANRRETPADFRNQLSLIFEVLDALGIQRLSVPGYEADDIIATLTTEAEQAGLDVLIVTGDRDVLQLVDEHTTALMTRRGITEMTRFTPEAVTAKYGLTPAQYPDYAALRGDPSDKLPGARGVGPKKAAELLGQYRTLEDALAAGRFAAEAEDLRLYRRIATVDASAPLPPLEDQNPTWAEASTIAKDWALNALAERLAKFG
jgi:DNA polymerase-1